MKRSFKLVLGWLGLIFAAVVGGVLGAALGFWVAMFWDVAVILVILAWFLLGTRRRAQRERTG